MILRIQETLKTYQEKKVYQNNVEKFDLERVKSDGHEDFELYRAKSDADTAKLLAIKQLPAAPKNLQEQLIWGILNLDTKATEDALNAGATLDAYPLYNPVQPYALLFSAIDQYKDFFHTLNNRAGNNESLSLDEVVRCAHIIRTIYEMFALLIKHGASVDEDLGMYLGQVRYLFDHELWGTPDNEEPTYIKEFWTYFKLMAQNLRASIEKYQPAPQVRQVEHK